MKSDQFALNAARLQIETSERIDPANDWLTVGIARRHLKELFVHCETLTKERNEARDQRDVIDRYWKDTGEKLVDEARRAAASRERAQELKAALSQLLDSLSLGQTVASTHDNRFNAAVTLARRALAGTAPRIGKPVRDDGEIASTAEPVVQHVARWEDWPDDVRERLHNWNVLYLLSFRRGKDFVCEGCGRQIQAHPVGDAVLRPHRKAHGVRRCEDCVVSIARCYALPPPTLAPCARDLERGWQSWIGKLEKHAARLKQQLWVDQQYMDRLEAEISSARLAEIHRELRGRYRREEVTG